MSDRHPNTGASIVADVRDHFSGAQYVLLLLAGITLAAYGFELFSFNLTIDEELHALSSFDHAAWVSQGRWAMYLLNRLMLPYTVVPVVSLAIGLCFHFVAVMLTLRTWGIRDRTNLFFTGAVALATPTAAYMYTFTTIAYGMGVGLFFSALSAYLFFIPRGRSRYWATVPAALALGTYQAFGQTLLALFLVALVREWLEGRTDRRLLIDAAAVGAISVVAALVVQRVFVLLVDPPASGYIDSILLPSALLHHPTEVVRRLATVVSTVYSGDAAVYAHAAFALPIVIGVCLLVLAWRSRTAPTTRGWRVTAFVVGVGVLLVPFAGGLVSNGNITIRFLVALPFALAGLISIGVSAPGRWRMVPLVLSALMLVQFVTTTNSLFGASHLALEQDRQLGGSMISAIEEQTAALTDPPEFLFIVGVPIRHSNLLIPRIDTFGASFFEWDGGSRFRSSAFLATLGFDQLAPLPGNRFIEFVDVAATMPNFPAPGSVLVVDDVVVVRLSPLSYAQRNYACDSLLLAEVCP
jgi:hypothetical protein